MVSASNILAITESNNIIVMYHNYVLTKYDPKYMLPVNTWL